MAKIYDELNQEQITFIQNQKLFFVGTAPTTDGRVNVSPKGYNTLKIIDTKTAIYVDYYGSGNETAIHLIENQKITLMWCSFEEMPLILRVYGKGSVISKDSNEFTELLNNYYPKLEKRIIRQIFNIEVEAVQDSCGWGVPYMSFVNERSKLEEMSLKHCK